MPDAKERRGDDCECAISDEQICHLDIFVPHREEAVITGHPT
jgi:hypothetical protein